MSRPVQKDRQGSAAVCFAVLFLVVLATTSIALGCGLFDRMAAQEDAAHRAELRKALGLQLHPSVRPGSLGSKRQAAVQKTLEPLLVTLPRNALEKLNATTVRYTVHRYFKTKYGWGIRGFEPHGGNTTKFGDAAILRENVPSYVDGVLETKLSENGFREDDVVMLIAAIEQLIFDQMIDNVESAFRINAIPVEEKLEKSGMLSILQSFMIEGILEGNFSDPVQHTKDRSNIWAYYPNWNTVLLFMEDIIGADAYESKLTASPFARGGKPVYSFEDTARMATRIMEEFGPWANYECGNLKESLVVMDPHNTGRVRLADFYKASQEGNWHFQESRDYLRQLGALDESSASLGPQVLIANYIGGMSNCLLSTHYYSICCMDTCEPIHQQIEARIGAPFASVQDIALAAEGAWDLNLSAPQRNTTLRNDLEKVAAANDGKVPLHSRLFAQWLHFVFPRDCPYPHARGTIMPETPGQLTERAGMDAVTAQDHEMEQHIEQQLEDPHPDAGAAMWIGHEEHLAPHATVPIVDRSKTMLSFDATLALAACSVALAAAIGTLAARMLVRARQLGIGAEAKAAEATGAEAKSSSEATVVLV